MAVLADVSMKSKLLSSAYACASWWQRNREAHAWEITQILKCILFGLYLEIDGPLVGQVRFVPCQSDNNVWAGLSLQLFHPVLCTCESVLKKKRKKKRETSGFFFYVLHMTVWHKSTKVFNEWSNHQPKQEDKGQRTDSKSQPIWAYHSLCWWCHTQRWLPGRLGSTWAPSCGNAPGPQCPRFQTWLLCHPSIPSVWGRPLRGKQSKVCYRYLVRLSKGKTPNVDCIFLHWKKMYIFLGLFI